MKPQPHSILLAASAFSFALLVLPAHAATNIIFSDDFGTSETLGTINDFGYYTQANSGGPWGVYATSTGETMTGNFLRNGGSSANTNSIKQWTPVTLAGAGDSIAFSFDMDSRGAYSASAALNMKIALYDSSYTITQNQISGINPFEGNVSGYGYFQDSAGANVYRLTDYETTANLGGTPDAILPPAELYDMNVHSLTFRITREAVGATFTLHDGANLLYSHTDLTAASFTFNTLRLQIPGVGTGGTHLDNFSVIHTTAIPEPSSAAALAGLATLGLVAARRRRQ